MFYEKNLDLGNHIDHLSVMKHSRKSKVTVFSKGWCSWFVFFFSSPL